MFNLTERRAKRRVMAGAALVLAVVVIAGAVCIPFLPIAHYARRRSATYVSTREPGATPATR